MAKLSRVLRGLTMRPIDRATFPRAHRPSRLLLLAIGAALLALMLPAWAAHAGQQEQREQGQGAVFDIPLEELMQLEYTTVFGASGYSQLVSEAPSSVTIVTAQDIQTYGWRSLDDILRSIRGFYTTYDRNYAYAGTRGFGLPGDYNTRLLLLLDGQRTADPVYGAAWVGTDFFLDVDLIERVEVIRGPASSLYGTNAYFAVINVVTKSGASFDGVQVSGDVLSYDTQKARVTYGHGFGNGAEALVSASFFGSAGPRELFFEEFDDPATNNGMAIEGDDENFQEFFASFEVGDFTLQGGRSWREKGFPTAAFGTVFNDRRNRTHDNQTFVHLEFERPLGDDEARVLGRAFFNQYDYEGIYIYDWAEEEGEEPFLVPNLDTVDGMAVGGELNYSRIVYDRHKFLFGGEAIYNIQQDQYNADVPVDDEPWVYLDDHRTSHTWALYAQDDVSLGNHFRVNAGLRYDHYTAFGGTTNPRLALIFDPVPGTTLKALYGRAFRAPSAYELFYNDDGETHKPAGVLEPEVINTFELVYEQLVGQHMRTTVSGFHYVTDNLIEFVTDPEDDLLVFVNGGTVEATGFEAELEGRWGDGLETRVSYSFQNSLDGDTEERLTNSPRHMGKANVRVPLYSDRLFAGIELQLSSRRLTVLGTEADSFQVANFTLTSPRLLGGLDASFSLYNAFDQSYGYPGSEEHVQAVILQNGRTVRLKLTYSF